MCQGSLPAGAVFNFRFPCLTMRQVVDTAARQQGKDREAHLNVGHAERIPGKPAVFSKVRLNKARMGFQLAVKVRCVHPVPKRFAEGSGRSMFAKSSCCSGVMADNPEAD